MRARLQVWFDAWAMEGFLRTAGGLVPQTLLPVLRLVSGDPARVDRQYAALRRHRRSLDPALPIDERRKRKLEAFVRELEWTCGELSHYMNREQYEALVTGTVARMLEARLAPLLPGLARMLAGQTPSRSPSLRGRWLEHVLGRKLGPLVARRIQPVSFLYGEVRLRHFTPERGEAEFFIPNCELRGACGPGEPARQSCARVCKAAVEAVCHERAPLRVQLYPAADGSCHAALGWDATCGARRSARPSQAFVPEARLLRGRSSHLWN